MSTANSEMPPTSAAPGAQAQNVTAPAPVISHKSPMREPFDRIAAKFRLGTTPLTRDDVGHLLTLARAQVDANEPMPCGHAEKYAVIHIPGGTTCLMCEFARSRHGHAEKESA